MVRPLSTPTWSHCVSGRQPYTANGTHLIGILDGDGCGPELIAATLHVLEALGLPVQIRRGGLIGSSAERQLGTAMPADVAQFCREIFAAGGAVLHGAGGGRFVYDLRREFDLFCKINPVRVPPELSGISRFKPEHLAAIDFVVVRENSAGVYQGRWRDTRAADGNRTAEHSFSYTETEVRRIIAVAARIAAQRRGELAVVVKDGGVPGITKLWRDCALEVTGVRTRMINVDFAAYELIQNPQSFDVVVTPNLFGDILVDASGALLGSRGLGCSGNYSATAAVYQTNHGAAHDLAGQDVANPAGQILSLAMLLRESFGLAEAADRIELAVRKVWSQGWRTADIAEPGSRLVGTRAMGEIIAAAVAQP